MQQRQNKFKNKNKKQTNKNRKYLGHQLYFIPLEENRQFTPIQLDLSSNSILSSTKNQNFIFVQNLDLSINNRKKNDSKTHSHANT